MYLCVDVEASKLARRRHSRTSSVGAANPRLFDKNTLVPNNVHPNKIEHPHAKSVPNGTVAYDAPSSPQKPKRTVSLWFLTSWTVNSVTLSMNTSFTWSLNFYSRCSFWWKFDRFCMLSVFVHIIFVSRANMTDASCHALIAREGEWLKLKS